MVKIQMALLVVLPVGSIRVFTNKLTIENGGTIEASNFDSLGVFSSGTGEPGNISIEANSISLANGGRIDAATQSETGDSANINLRVVDNITLRDNSFISARAFENANGGNVNIDTEFIIAFPNQNNDIIASAAQGQGGNINITAEGVFGIEERPLNPLTNDINASSEFGLSGTVNITQPTVDPASGLVDLTQEVVNASDLIAQNVCTQTANSEFVDIGKGGLPQNPEYVLTEDTIEVGLVAPIMASEEEIKSDRETAAVKPQKTLKPPAQGWIFHENGIVELVAYNPARTGAGRTWDNYRGCQD
ncbi:MAG: S-layer family protein [Xenococcaceae cyanobacterium MO_188.B32]|nr:S-layer family protein [Xenococcaceae cyanobacterium MO_188.B32]